jgi:hypothetical protein
MDSGWVMLIRFFVVNNCRLKLRETDSGITVDGCFQQ